MGLTSCCPLSGSRDLPDNRRLQVESMVFGPASHPVRQDRPRPWTLAQATWGGEPLETLFEGAVLELCSGAGHIGLALAANTTRRVVLVDKSVAACGHARTNADANALSARVDVRNAAASDLAAGVRPGAAAGRPAIQQLGDPAQPHPKQVGGLRLG